jgi:hypothetical protein
LKTLWKSTDCGNELSSFGDILHQTPQPCGFSIHAILQCEAGVDRFLDEKINTQKTTERLVSSAEITNCLYVIHWFFWAIYYMILRFLLSMHKPFLLDMQAGLLWARKRQFGFPECIT